LLAQERNGIRCVDDDWQSRRKGDDTREPFGLDAIARGRHASTRVTKKGFLSAKCHSRK